MFTIDNDKLIKVTNKVNQTIDPKVTEETIEQTICADWNEGQEHQEWINNASVEEIVSWLASFYS